MLAILLANESECAFDATVPGLASLVEVAVDAADPVLEPVDDANNVSRNLNLRSMDNCGLIGTGVVIASRVD